VTATTKVGESPPSQPSAPVIVYQLPLAPVITSATASNGQVIVDYTASAADQALMNPISSCTVTIRKGSGGGGQVIGTVTKNATPVTVNGVTTYTGPPVTVNNLTNGTNYTVTVHATNGAGSGPESPPTAFTPATVPGAPTKVTATDVTPGGAATGTVNLTFTAPASNGGVPVQSYTAVSSPGGITATSGNGTPRIQVTGLTLGTSYTFTVYATNPTGNGPPSAPSNAVTPEPAPSPPQVPGAAAVDIAPPPPSDLGAAYVSCLPPASDGGSPIVSYTVTSSPGGITATGSSCPVLVTGPTAGTTYTFTVTATNADGGTSQPSRSTAKVTPKVAPSGPEPANDNFAEARAISGASGSVSGTNVAPQSRQTSRPSKTTAAARRCGTSGSFPPPAHTSSTRAPPARTWPRSSERSPATASAA
jgi:hypothetical protein